MGLIILRCMFVLVAAGLGVSLLILRRDSRRLGLDGLGGFRRSDGRRPGGHRPRYRHPQKTSRHDHGRLFRHDRRPVSDLRSRAGAGAAVRSAIQDSPSCCKLVLGLVLCYTCISLLDADQTISASSFPTSSSPRKSRACGPACSTPAW